jgi:hypothetical protein
MQPQNGRKSNLIVHEMGFDKAEKGEEENYVKLTPIGFILVSY